MLSEPPSTTLSLWDNRSGTLRDASRYRVPGYTVTQTASPRPSPRGERRQEQLGDNLLDEMSRVHQKAWELLAKTESEGDHRGSIVALREVRECLESLGEMLAKADRSRHTGMIEHVLTEREKREAEESLKTLLADQS
jgi:hypothetical protein